MNVYVLALSQNSLLDCTYPSCDDIRWYNVIGGSEVNDLALQEAKSVQPNLLPTWSNIIYTIDIIQLSPDPEINVLKTTYSTVKQLNTSLNFNSFIQSLFVLGAEVFIVSPNVYCSNFLKLFSILQPGEKICLLLSLENSLWGIFRQLLGVP